MVEENDQEERREVEERENQLQMILVRVPPVVPWISPDVNQPTEDVSRLIVWVVKFQRSTCQNSKHALVCTLAQYSSPFLRFELFIRRQRSRLRHQIRSRLPIKPNSISNEGN